jgi:hypothetical protein
MPEPCRVEEIMAHLWHCLTAEPRNQATTFSHTATTNDNTEVLFSYYMTRQYLCCMTAPITGNRALGEWSLEVRPRKERGKGAACNQNVPS